MNFFRKLANWYFRRNSLPYWSILVLDELILLLSGIAAYWIFTDWSDVTTHMVPLITSLFVYMVLSIIGTLVRSVTPVLKTEFAAFRARPTLAFTFETVPPPLFVEW